MRQIDVASPSAPAASVRSVCSAGLVDVLSGRTRLEYRVLCGLWVAAVALFWVWWDDPTHVAGPTRFLLNSALVLWTMVLPGYYLFFLGRMKRQDPAASIPAEWRVAMVVTKAPSEPFAVVRATLEAMLRQPYPHDTWLADEDPTPEVIEWCRVRGIQVSTRKGVSAYHRPTWPRRARCKEGNLAYFYDTYGYAGYDVVVQMDADQRPGPAYLEAMLRPFVDPRVGYVSAPSICDANATESWAARGRLYAEGTLHGSLQAGYNAGWAPLCIGSHYAIRTAALVEIGGLGPELAEDHSTSLMFNAHGWKGVHAFDAEAHGDGPMSFEDCMTQEYQWSRSLTTILLTVTPDYWRRLPARLKAQFLFAQLWYPCLGLSMLTGISVSIIALLTGEPWVSLSYIEFLLYKMPVTAAAFLIVTWVRRNGWLRPRDSKILTWETVLFQLARWPWVLAGCIAAAIGEARGRQVEFKVTPKGDGARGALPMKVMAPYWMIAAMSGSVAALRTGAGSVSGYYYLAIVTSVTYATLVFVAALMHLVEGSGRGGVATRQSRGSQRARVSTWTGETRVVSARVGLAVAALIFIFPLMGIVRHGREGLVGVSWGHERHLWQICRQADQVCDLIKTAVPVNFGVYDPEGAYRDEDKIAIEHLFVRWNAYDRSAFRAVLGDAAGRGRWPLVTVEPWPDVGWNRERLFSDTAAGRYDRSIANVCGDLGAFGRPVFVRWGHEMDYVTGRYPWAQEDAAGFVAAYRHFVETCRASGASQAFYVWSPVGTKQARRYWPGRAYADYVGLSVYGFPDWDLARWGSVRSFDEIFAEKYRGIADLDRPVMITELGVTGTREHQARWMDEALRSAGRYPQLRSIVYFHSIDSREAWPAEFLVPDWRMDLSGVWLRFALRS